MATTTSSRLSTREIAAVAYGAGFRGDALQTAIAVALAESGGNPRARNLRPGKEDSRGLWQINTLAHPQYAADRLYEPGYNALAAWEISKGGTDWSPWGAYTGSDAAGSDGPWRDHLPAAQQAAGADLQGIAAGFAVPPTSPLDPRIILEGLGWGAEQLFGDGPLGDVGEIVLIGGLTLLFTATGLALIAFGVFALTGAGSPRRTYDELAQVVGVGGTAKAIVR